MSEQHMVSSRSEGQAGLKPERIQEPLDLAAIQERLAMEAADPAASMAGWRDAGDGSAIDRVKHLATPGLAALYGAHVLGCAGEAGLPATVNVLGGYVQVTLHAPREYGESGFLMPGMLALARQLG
jgi:hypothetical protein